MKTKTNSIVFTLLIFLMACQSGQEKKAEEQAPLSTLFQVIMIKHPVADFEAWKAVYEEHDSVRQAHGISQFVLARGMDDSNLVVIMNKFTDLAKAKEFTNMPELKETMKSAGVTGEPSFSFANVIRNDDTKIDIRERVMISHKVKDFDAWLKVFDAEGTQTRAENGIIDRGLARDADDPNKVYIVFAISDMQKAQARMNSEDLKKLMMDAGVEGPPEFTFYRIESIK